MKIISHEEFLSFIFSQPRERNYETNGFVISLTYGEVQDFLIKKGEKNPLAAEIS